VLKYTKMRRIWCWFQSWRRRRKCETVHQ